MNKYLIKVKGKNVRNFLLKASKNNINILNIEEINNDEINIVIEEKYLDLLSSIKGIYEYEVIKEYGYNALINEIKKNMHLFIFIMINTILISFSSNYIYEIEVIEDNQELKNFIIEILEAKDIKKYSKKPSDLEKIKEEILDEFKDKLEWIEIIPSGIKYIVKAEERIENKVLDDVGPSNMVAKKDGIVKKIIASSGKVMVEKDTFVKKGDILISGIVNEEKIIRSKGDVYANVWYKVKVEASLHEKNYEKTGKKKRGIKIKFFDKEIKLYKDYKTSKVNEKILLKNDILPIKITLDEIIETNIIDHILTFEEAKKIAIAKAIEKIEKKLKEDERIISENELKVREKDSKIIIEVLFTIYENISLEERIEVKNVQTYNRSGN